MASDLLLLQIVLKEPYKHYDYKLAFGDQIVVGRDADCDLCIDDPSLSRKHAEFLWDGQELKISNLKSTNGMYFQSKKVEHLAWDPEKGALKLKLGRLKLELNLELSSSRGASDRTEAQSSRELTKTLQKNLPAVSAQKRNESVVAAQEQKEALKSEEGLSQQEEASVEKKVSYKNSFIFFFFLGFFCFAGMRRFWVPKMGALLDLKYSELKKGALWDLSFLYQEAFGALFVVFLFTSLLYVLHQRGKISFQFLRRFLKDKVSFFSVKSVVVLLFSVLLFYPFSWHSFYKAPSYLWKTFQYRSQIKKLSSYTEKIEYIEKKALLFQGSSFVFKDYLDFKFKNILNACSSRRVDDSWERKKLCLILLQSSAIEAFERLKPVLLADQVGKLMALLALDALIRMNGAGDLNSKNVLFFLKSLERVGASEKDLVFFRQLSAYNDFSGQEALSDELLKQRLLLEQKRKDLILKKRIPAQLVLEIPNTLEAGL